MFEMVKFALGLTGNEFDAVVSDLIESAMADLGVAGVDKTEPSDPLVRRAIITYCRANFSMFGLPDGYDKLKESYDEQKAQMSMATGYTDWNV